MSWIWQAQGGGNGGAGGGGAPSWKTVYEVNFATEASRSIGASGAYTIAGRTWWAKGELVYNFGGNNTYTLNVTNGTGLVWTSSTASGLFFSPGSTFPGRVLWLPLAQFDVGLSPSPFCLQFVIGTPTPGVTPFMVCGFADMASSAAACTGTERNSMWGVCRPSGAPGVSGAFGTMVNLSLSTTTVLAVGLTPEATEYGIMRLSNSAECAFGNAAVASFTVPSTGRMGTTAPGQANQAVRANPGIYIGYQNALGAFSTDTLMRLRLAQFK